MSLGSSESLMTPDERDRVVVEWNATTVPFAREVPVHELVRAQAARTPDAVAVVGDDASLAYRDLAAVVRRRAAHLRRLGVGADVPVAVYADRSLHTVVELLAVLAAGG